MQSPAENQSAIERASMRIAPGEPLPHRDPRYVSLDAARGGAPHMEEYLGALRAASSALTLDVLKGQRGSGRSTELRRMAHEVCPRAHMLPILYDASALRTRPGDGASIAMPDILLGLLGEMMAVVRGSGLAIPDDPLWRMCDSLGAVLSHSGGAMASLRPELEGLGAAGYVERTADAALEALTHGSTDAPAIRGGILDNMGAFLGAMGSMLGAVAGASGARALVLAVDGLDRLRPEEATATILELAEIGRLMGTRVLVSAPIRTPALTYPACNVYRLPAPRASHEGPGLFELLMARAGEGLFDNEGIARELVRYSGGLPGELMRLMHYALVRAEGGLITGGSVQCAIERRASEFRRLLNTGHYRLLYELDYRATLDAATRDVAYLLDVCALIEYPPEDGAPGSYVRASHPTIRDLSGYHQP